MKKPIFELSNFKKVSETHTHAILKHPEGHEIKVSKEALAPHLKKQLGNLPMHFADGGDTLAPPEGPQPDPEPTPNPQPEPTPAPQPQQDQTQAAPQNYQMPQQQAGARMPATNSPDYLKQMQQGFGMQQQGIEQNAQALSQQGESAAKAAQQHDLDLQNLMAEHQKQYGALQNEIQNTVKDIDNKQIDPSHYLHSMSAPGRVATAIGLILGGIGGALTHQENPAMKFLQSQIDRDVEGQKMDLGKKQNLLSAYFKQTGDLNSATAMTRAFYAEKYSNDLQKAAAQAQTPKAKAAGLQAAGALKTQSAQVLQPLAMKQTVLNGMQRGLVSPEQAVPFVGAPPEVQKEIFKEIEQAQNAKRNKDMILQQFDIAAKSPLKSIGIGEGDAANKRMDALFLPLIHDKEGRVNEYELKTLTNLQSKGFDSDAKTASKRQGLIDFIDSKASAPTAKSYGIDLSRYPSTSSINAKPNSKAGYGAR